MVATPAVLKKRDCCRRKLLQRSRGVHKKEKAFHSLCRRRMRQSPITVVTSAADWPNKHNTSGVEEEGLLSSQAPPAIPGGTAKKKKPFIRFAHYSLCFFTCV